MGKGFKHGFGGGNNLNFRVKAYPSSDALPETAAGNTIAVFTGEKITGWKFSAARPEGTEGLVWFKTGDSGVLELETLKRNGITVYPMECWQCVANVWRRMKAMVWLDGWQEMTGYKYLYREGDTCDAVGGQWISEPKAADSSVSHEEYIQAPTVIYGEKTMTVYMDADTNQGGIFHKKEKIDITGYSRLRCAGTYVPHGGIVLTLWSEIGAYQYDNVVVSKTANEIGSSWYLDLTNVPDGEYIAGLSFWGARSNNKMTFDWIRLE